MHPKKLRVGFCVLCMFAAGAWAAGAHAQTESGGTISPVQKCADLVNLHIPGTNMTIAKAVKFPPRRREPCALRASRVIRSPWRFRLIAGRRE